MADIRPLFKKEGYEKRTGGPAGKKRAWEGCAKLKKKKQLSASKSNTRPRNLSIAEADSANQKRPKGEKRKLLISWGGSLPTKASFYLKCGRRG